MHRLIALKVSVNQVVNNLNIELINAKDRVIEYQMYSPSRVQVAYKTRNSKEDIDTSTLPSGVYTLIARIDAKILSEQIIVK